MRHRVGGEVWLIDDEVGRVERFDGAAVRAWARGAATALEAAREPIDSLNVFPVADADTGTNLYLTISQGAEDQGAEEPDAGAAMARFAQGALLGARGNSGVIASQWLLGFARSLPDDAAPVDGPRLAAALDGAQAAARAAVARPVEGTILTAASAAAAAARAGGHAGLGVTALAALRGARVALARTTDELAVLRAAQVVDAGATGLVVILEALVAVLTGRPAPGAVPIVPRARLRPSAPASLPELAAPDRPGLGCAALDGEFEVMFVVERTPGEAATSDLAPGLSARLQAIGESVAVVGGPDVWQVHVHTDDPAAAVAAGASGVQRQVTVRHLRQQVADHADPAELGAAAVAGPAGPGVRPADRLGLVVGTRAPALLRELARGGAVVMVLTAAAATVAGVMRAAIDTGASRVAVLPGAPDAHAAALVAADALGRSSTATGPGQRGMQVTVFDAQDSVRAVAGLAAVVAGRSATTGLDPVTELAAIGAAVAAVRTADVVVADPDDARRVADGLLAAGGDVLTLLRGASANDAVLDALLAHLAAEYPALEVVVLDGGQASPALALAVE